MAKGKKPGGGGSTGGGGSNTVPAPTGLTATNTPLGVYLQWNPVTNAQAYWVYINGGVSAIVTVTNYTASYLKSGITNTIQVAAVVNNVLGQKSASVTVNT